MQTYIQKRNIEKMKERIWLYVAIGAGVGVVVVFINSIVMAYYA